MDEAAPAQQAFVDSVPAGDAPESAEAQGERSGRRRNRRGGRGRDRDDVQGEGNGQAGAENGEAPVSESGEAAPAASASIDADGAPADGAPAGDANGRGEAGESRRRGRGRDRNRRDRGEEAGAEGVVGEGQDGTRAAPAAAYDAAPPAEPAPVSLTDAAYETSAILDVPTVESLAMPSAATETASLEAAVHVPSPVYGPMADEAVAEPVAAAPAAVAAPAPVPVAAPAPAPVVAAAPTPVRAEPFVLPLGSLQAVAESAGLQWVNSDADKIRAVQAAMASEPTPAHVPRERKPVESIDTGPLVLVETRKDLSQFKLPFENAQSGTQGASQP